MKIKGGLTDKERKAALLKETRIKNMMKWQEEDYEFYRGFFKMFTGTDKIPYQKEVERRKRHEQNSVLTDEEYAKESYRRFLVFMKEVEKRYKDRNEDEDDTTCDI